MKFVSIDLASAEARTALADSGDATAAFDRAFALTCLESAAALLEAEYAARGRSSLYAVLRPFLDPTNEQHHADAATAAGLELNALRQAIFRLRQRFRILLRQVVADTLRDPSEQLIEEELAALRAALTA